ncbi:MAG: thioredoxin family protein [Candidatus Thiodiazotropha sp.]
MLKRIALSITLLFGASQLQAAGEEKGLDQGMVNPGFHEKPAWFKNSFLDLQEDLQEAADEGKRLVLYFHQDGCPYCAKLLNENFSIKAIVDRTKQAFQLIAINIWGDREVTGLRGESTTEKAFAASMKVMYTPTLLFLNEQGQRVLRINGYYAPHRFLAALDYVADGEERRLSFRDYLARGAAGGLERQAAPPGGLSAAAAGSASHRAGRRKTAAGPDGDEAVPALR